MEACISVFHRFVGERSYLVKTRYSTRKSMLVLSILVLSIADAFFTLNIIAKGGVELNPIMDVAIQKGVVFFLASKYILTSFGVLTLCILGSVSFARRALLSTFFIYLTLTAFHLTFSI